MSKEISSKFQSLYEKIAQRKNYREPAYRSTNDNYILDIYNSGEYFARMSNGGYDREVGRMVDGKVIWKACDYYPRPVSLSGISEEEFLSLEV